MKRMSRVIVMALALASPFAVAEDAPQSVIDLTGTLKTWGVDEVLVSAVRAQNEAGLTLDAIKARDNEWRGTEGLDDEMQAMMENTAAKRLLELEKTQPFYFELFLMDNQGANVAMTNKTSDYWQGDEAKWQESFKGGAGAVHIGPVEFDDSAQAYLVQVTVPVMDADQAIGAITIGVNLDELEGQ